MSRSLLDEVEDVLAGNDGNFGADVLKRSSDDLACMRFALGNPLHDVEAISSAMAQLEERMRFAAKLINTAEVSS